MMRFFLLIFNILLIFFSSCSKKDPLPDKSLTSSVLENNPVAVPNEKSDDETNSFGIRPIAIIKSGNYPLWFELGNGDTCPTLINTPSSANLVNFTPWPLSRYVQGMILDEKKLVLTINREGFLIIAPWEDDGLALYRITNTEYWENYTIASLFLFKEKPFALLYRNDFFTDSSMGLPSPRFFTYQRENYHL